LRKIGFKLTECLVRVKEGSEVKKGDILCVQSAMKVFSISLFADAYIADLPRWNWWLARHMPVRWEVFKLRRAIRSTVETLSVRLSSLKEIKCGIEFRGFGWWYSEGSRLLINLCAVDGRLENEITCYTSISFPTK
jgi:hypothetical protein